MASEPGENHSYVCVKQQHCQPGLSCPMHAIEPGEDHSYVSVKQQEHCQPGLPILCTQVNLVRTTFKFV